MRFQLLILLALMTVSCKQEQPNPRANVNAAPSSTVNTNAKQSPPRTNADLTNYGYEIVNTYKHDPKSFTQGLIFRDGVLYESTGGYGESSLRRVDLETGKILQNHDVPEDFFAEGMTVFGDRLYQLTWRENTAFVYDPKDFKLLKQIKYAGEGWGLTHDNKNLIMSDGTHVIRFVDPETFETLRTVTVFDEKGAPLVNLNELEFVNGEIWANVWHSEGIGKPNHIARISPQDGRLLGWINLEGLSPQDTERDAENTLNGIAYDPSSDRIFVTGKRWRNLYEIKLKPQQ